VIEMTTRPHSLTEEGLGVHIKTLSFIKNKNNIDERFVRFGHDGSNVGK
jgi:hypothetical protein